MATGLWLTIQIGSWETHFRIHKPEPETKAEQPPHITPTPMQAYVGFVPTIEHSETFEVS